MTSSMLCETDSAQKPGNVKLHPELLGKHQKYVQEQLKTDDPRPVACVHARFNVG